MSQGVIQENILDQRGSARTKNHGIPAL